MYQRITFEFKMFKVEVIKNKPKMYRPTLNTWIIFILVSKNSTNGLVYFKVLRA